MNSGQFRYYRTATQGAAPVAASVWWNASTPGGSGLDIYFREGSSSCTSGTRVNVPSQGSIVTFASTSTTMAFCIDLDSSSNNQYSPTLFDFNLVTYTNAPRDIKIDIFDADEGSPTSCGVGGYEWEYDGVLSLIHI